MLLAILLCSVAALVIAFCVYLEVVKLSAVVGALRLSQPVPHKEPGVPPSPTAAAPLVDSGEEERKRIERERLVGHGGVTVLRSDSPLENDTVVTTRIRE